MNSAAQKINFPAKPQTALQSLSIIVPAFNEEKTIYQVLEKIMQVPLGRPFEIIIVNDGSTDGTVSQVRRFQKHYPDVNMISINQSNQGKGGAFKTGLYQARMDLVIVQDADLEYSPMDYLKILESMDKGAQVVYGSRNLKANKRPHSSLLFYWGGQLVTLVTNWLYGSSLTDEATGYKCFRRELIKSLRISHLDFGWEPEVTAQILKSKIEIAEVPISYFPRPFSAGKKISWKDGVIALWVLLHERFRKD